MTGEKECPRVLTEGQWETLSGGPAGGEGTISGNRVLQESFSSPESTSSPGKAVGGGRARGAVLRARAGTAGAKLGREGWGRSLGL